MIQHMNLVFQAGGLEVGEFAFLMACCNHTDDRGNVIAKMQQLADEAHMPLSTARAKKSKLIKRGLLARGERYSPKNNAQLADLLRVNLELLASMKRPRVDYGPTLVEELTFAVPQEAQETPSSNPPLDPSGGGAEIQRGGRWDSAGGALDPSGAGALKSSAHLLPSSSPSSLSGPGRPSGDADRAGEREAATPEDDPAVSVAEGWAKDRTAHGLSTSPARMKAFVAEARRLLAQGVDVARLEAAARRMASEPTWFSLAKQLEAMPAVPAQGVRPLPSRPPAGPDSPELSAAARAILERASGL